VVRWWCERRNQEVELDTEITPERMMECVLQSKSKWDAVAKYITTVMTMKEANVREIQAAALQD